MTKRLNYSRAAKIYGLTLVLSVICLSFAYGLVRGLRAPQVALAREYYPVTNDEVEISDLVSGIELERVGSGATRINGKPVELYRVLSERNPAMILRQQEERWKQLGFQTAGIVDRQRGVLVARDLATNERYAFMLWTVIPKMRQEYSSGYRTTGFVSKGAAEISAVTQDFELQGAVPNVPIPTGGQGGAVMVSQDLGNTSYHSTYTLPGNISENLDFYRRELIGNGYREKTGSYLAADESGAMIEFISDSEHVTLLFQQSKLSGRVSALVTRVAGSIGIGEGNNT
ncbi:hypothetical protein JNK13_04110 [bacterium]|nr:hypothetical protein [bacterium]